MKPNGSTAVPTLALIAVLVAGACGADDPSTVEVDTTTTSAPAGEAPSAGDPSAPDQPVTTAPPDGTIGPGGRGSEPMLVEPVGDAVDVRAQPFDDLVADDDGDSRTWIVAFTGGVAPCHVVDRVEIDETAESVTITLYTGAAAGSGEQACIQIAQRQGVAIELAAPLGDRAVVDGAA